MPRWGRPLGCAPFTLVREGYLRLRGKKSSASGDGRTILPTEVEALLDYRGGLLEYHRDEAWQRAVIAQYRFNMRRMIEMARAAGVKVVLFNPVSNLSDSPPFKSEHREDLSPEELKRWEANCDEAGQCVHGSDHNLHQAARLFKQACQIDPLHAGCFYNLAKCYEGIGRFDEARDAYLQAKELDVCPLRILQPMNEAVLEIARDTATPLVDADKLFRERSPHGIVGGQWLVDHVHPGIEGHQLLADALASVMVSGGLVQPRPQWEEVKQARYREHLDSLDAVYFARGQEHLENLRGWASGRADACDRPRMAPCATRNLSTSAAARFVVAPATVERELPRMARLRILELSAARSRRFAKVATWEVESRS